MNLSTYIQDHPDRLTRLNQSDKWFAEAGENPIYMDTERGLLDIYTTCSLIALYGGTALKTPIQSLISYLKSLRALRHPDDTAERFEAAVEELRALQKINAKDYRPRELPDNPAPFFIHPETAFGFMRYHLRNSPQMYGQPLALSSLILPVHAKQAMAEAFDNMKQSNFHAWYFAINNVTVKLRTVKTFSEAADPKIHLDVYAQVGAGDVYHARQAIEGNSYSFKLPSLAEIMQMPDIVKYLPKRENLT